MKSVKSWLLLLGVMSPLLLGGCRFDQVGRATRDAAIDGIAAAVQDAVFFFADGILPPIG